MIKDAIEGYIASLEKHGEPVPPGIEEAVEVGGDFRVGAGQLPDGRERTKQAARQRGPGECQAQHKNRHVQLVTQRRLQEPGNHWCGVAG